MDGDGTRVLEVETQPRLSFMGSVFPLVSRPDDREQSFLVQGSGPKAPAQSYSLITVSDRDDGVLTAESTPSTEVAWWRTSREALTVEKDGNEPVRYHAARAAVSGQIAPVGLSGKVLRVTVWKSTGERAAFVELPARSGAGRCGQAMGEGALTTIVLPTTGKSVWLAGWGTSLWVLDPTHLKN
jgi:hypothetical protein